jgi:hypothetical protein
LPQLSTWHIISLFIYQIKMSTAETLIDQGARRIEHARDAVVVALGTILTDIYANNLADLKTGAGVGEHVLKAIPSAFEPAEVSDDLLGKPNPTMDLAIDVGPLALSTAMARESMGSTKELALLALSAQAAASGADIAAVEGHLLSRAEMAEKDVGGSALTTAFFTRVLFDKIARSETEKQRRVWQAVTAVFVGAVTVGAAYFDSKNFSTDLASHSAAAAVGGGSSFLGRQADGK